MQMIFLKDEQSFYLKFERGEFALAQKLLGYINFSPDTAHVGVAVCERLAKLIAEDVKPKKPKLTLVKE
jgi:hypothetical protein